MLAQRPRNRLNPVSPSSASQEAVCAASDERHLALLIGLFLARAAREVKERHTRSPHTPKRRPVVDAQSATAIGPGSVRNRMPLVERQRRKAKSAAQRCCQAALEADQARRHLGASGHDRSALRRGCMSVRPGVARLLGRGAITVIRGDGRGAVRSACRRYRHPPCRAPSSPSLLGHRAGGAVHRGGAR